MPLRQIRTLLAAFVCLMLFIDFVPAVQADAAVAVERHHEEEHHFGRDVVIVDAETGEEFLPPESLNATVASGSGYELMLSDLTSNMGAYEVRIVGSSRVSTYRKALTAVANDLRSLGLANLTIDGNVYSSVPETLEAGKIYVNVTDRLNETPCGQSANILGCALLSVIRSTARIQAAAAKLFFPEKIDQFSGEAIEYIVRHEMGHALGLGHYEHRHNGRFQVMFPSYRSPRGYQSGDMNGLAQLGGLNATAQNPIDTVGVSRISGVDRYASAVGVSRKVFSGKAPVVVLASGEVYPDALAAAPVAKKLGGSLLLTQHNALPEVTRQEIHRLQPSTIIVAGGKLAVSDAVVAELSSYKVVRVGGEDRYATSRELASYAFTSASKVYIASGRAFPDAISGGNAAAVASAPLILVDGIAPKVDADTLRQLQKFTTSQVVLTGGENVISSSVANGFTQSGKSVIRVGGQDRFLTSVAMSKHSFGDDQGKNAYVVTGMNFPDGLVSAVLASSQRGSLYLSSGSCVSGEVFENMSKRGVQNVVLVGGPHVLIPVFEQRLLEC